MPEADAAGGLIRVTRLADETVVMGWKQVGRGVAIDEDKTKAEMEMEMSMGKSEKVDNKDGEWNG